MKDTRTTYCTSKNPRITLQKIKGNSLVFLALCFIRLLQTTKIITNAVQNCLAYDYSLNCNLPPKCIRCSEGDKSSMCNHVSPETKRTPEEKVKCCNCVENHPANFSKCPSRLMYENFRKISTKASTKY